MAINLERTREGNDDAIRFYPMERLQVYLFGATVLFASFGMGEAVYRLLFSEFDGITDRIPVELLFGLVFAGLATKFVGGVYRNRKERSARLNFIWARNRQIRGALEGITPFGSPCEKPAIHQGNPRRGRQDRVSIEANLATLSSCFRTSVRGRNQGSLPSRAWRGNPLTRQGLISSPAELERSGCSPHRLSPAKT